MAVTEPTSSTALAVALIGVFGVIVAAILTAVFMWQVNRRVGKPNGNGNVQQSLDRLHETVGAVRTIAEDAKLEAHAAHAEASLARSMVEATASDFAVHAAEDREHFAQLFGEQYEART